MHLGKVQNFYPLLMGRSFYPFNLGRLRDEINILLGWFVFIVMFLEHVPTKCPHNRSLSAFINVVGTVRPMYTVRKKNKEVERERTPYIVKLLLLLTFDDV